MFSLEYQYRNTNIEALLNGIESIKQNTIYNAIETFKNDYRNLATAQGNALDLWGKRLKFARYLPLNDKVTYNKFNFYNKFFKELKFTNLSKANFVTLPDYEYRFILMLIFKGRHTIITIPNLNILASELFLTIGLNCKVFETPNLGKIKYIVNSKAPLWLKFVCENFDVLPRPAGIGAQIIEDLKKPIGFNQKEAENNKKITNFYFGNFKKRT